ncbi:hypothetical protein TNCV_3278961 [Trichonephila clavipes]|nr:hypothetical protein TNCV_3278961 [Trichonephila clavipes]
MSEPAAPLKTSHKPQEPHPHSALYDDTIHIKDVPWCTVVHHDASPNKNSYASKLVYFPYVGEMTANFPFSQDGNLPKITLMLRIMTHQ